ncbi:hypothetical protein [Photobacterium damselae]|uniref:hypothetical protein n=1 Tax=Photobacterium damselae TaxID=38293 RepID=UPI0040698821
MNSSRSIVEHYTFTSDRKTAIESLGEDFPTRTDDNIKHHTTFLDALEVVVEDGIKTASSELKKPSDIVAIRVLKPTHPVSIKAQALYVKYQRDLVAVELHLSKAMSKKMALRTKFSSPEYKSTLQQERMSCKSCGGVITVLRSTGCDCPICGEQGVLMKPNHRNQIKKADKRIDLLKLEIKTLTDAYLDDCAQLVKETDVSDYHWLALSLK